MSEFSELVENLKARQNADIDALSKPSPALEAAKSNLRRLFQAEGEPALSRLKEMAASEDFRAAVSIVSLDTSRFVGEGVSTDLLGRFDTERKRFTSGYNSILYQLENCPYLIERLSEDDIAPSRYPEIPTRDQQIAHDLSCASENVKEVGMRLASFISLVTKLESAPRRPVETFTPTGQINPDRKPANSNPAFAVTEGDRVVQV